MMCEQTMNAEMSFWLQCMHVRMLTGWQSRRKGKQTRPMGVVPITDLSFGHHKETLAHVIPPNATTTHQWVSRPTLLPAAKHVLTNHRD